MVHVLPYDWVQLGFYQFNPALMFDCYNGVGILGLESTLIPQDSSTPLGPAHVPHSQIRKHGAGQCSDWSDALYFATSDNSPPNRNGREYTVLFYSPNAS